MSELRKYDLAIAALRAVEDQIFAEAYEGIRRYGWPTWRAKAFVDEQLALVRFDLKERGGL